MGKVAILNILDCCKFECAYGTLAEIYSELRKRDKFYKNLKNALDNDCPVLEFIDQGIEIYEDYLEKEKFVNLLKNILLKRE